MCNFFLRIVQTFWSLCNILKQNMQKIDIFRYDLRNSFDEIRQIIVWEELATISLLFPDHLLTLSDWRRQKNTNSKKPRFFTQGTFWGEMDILALGMDKMARKMDKLTCEVDNLAEKTVWHVCWLWEDVNARYARRTLRYKKCWTFKNLGGNNYETCNVS